MKRIRGPGRSDRTRDSRATDGTHGTDGPRPSAFYGETTATAAHGGLPSARLLSENGSHLVRRTLRCDRMLTLLGVVLGAALWSAGSGEAKAQFGPPNANLNPYFYYPYHYYPWNYWPTQGPRWPEPVGQPYMRPPAYQAYPAFHEPHWRVRDERPGTLLPRQSFLAGCVLIDELPFRPALRLNRRSAFPG